ncbi:uncharacterized protein LOC131216745 [Anopheles bellator]|uniref:uncharacterized protein LOC131216745 n=1 Tax=Anopheles bellator TaxID=139047 RepID=UPI00264A09C4|nr:uncharacterized protein LOC131216745 [Anopheles bellator]
MDLCRICFAEGGRNIFHNGPAKDTFAAASVTDLAAKLRFVTMLEVEEHNGLSPFLCESCIVQLNVSYSFKRRAWAADVELRELRSHEQGSTPSIDQSSDRTVYEGVWVKDEAVIIDEISAMCSGELSINETAKNHRYHDQHNRTLRIPSSNSAIPTANSSELPPMVILSSVSLAQTQDEQFKHSILSCNETSPLATNPQSAKKANQATGNNKSKVKFNLSKPVVCDKDKHERSVPHTKLSVRERKADRLMKMLRIDMDLDKTHPSFSSARRVRKIKHRRYSVCAVVHGKLT